MTKKILKHIVFLIPLFGLTTPDEPCQKKFHSGDWRNITTVIFYPNCNDTTIYFVRAYQNNKLWREEWVKNNRPDGISRYYNTSDSNNIKVSETLWSNGNVMQNIDYFPNSIFTSSISKTISDSLSFEIRYYKNGNVKGYGNFNDYKNGPCGIWTECDSLNTYKWVGEYKIVNKVKNNTTTKNGIEITTTVVSPSEKFGTWKKLDKNNQILEQVIYVNGVIKKGH